MAVRHGYGKIAGTDALVFAYDTGDTRNSYIGEPTTNMWGIQSGTNVNNKSGWSMPYAYNGAITNSVYTSGTWNGNRIWEVLHTAGTSGYAGYESWRECVDQPTAGSGTYSTTRRVAIKICVLEGSITDMAIHSGGGNGGHNPSDWTPIPESQVPRDCPIKTGWYQFLADGSWSSDSIGHCVGLGFISYNRVRILTTEPMYYPSSKLLPFTGYQRSATQGLLDLTGNSTLDLANVSFDSNAQIDFDGTDDYIDTGKTATQLGMYDSSYTAECVCYPTNFNSDKAMFGTDQTAFRQGLHLTFRGGQIYMGHYSSDYGISSGTLNAWNHITFTYNASTSTASIYKNGVFQGSGTIQSFIGTTNILIGREFGAYNFAGDIAIAKIYNRALTADEVRNNYNQYKTRFNI